MPQTGSWKARLASGVERKSKGYGRVDWRRGMEICLEVSGCGSRGQQRSVTVGWRRKEG